MFISAVIIGTTIFYCGIIISKNLPGFYYDLVCCAFIEFKPGFAESCYLYFLGFFTLFSFFFKRCIKYLFSVYLTVILNILYSHNAYENNWKKNLILTLQLAYFHFIIICFAVKGFDFIFFAIQGFDFIFYSHGSSDSFLYMNGTGGNGNLGNTPGSFGPNGGNPNPGSGPNPGNSVVAISEPPREPSLNRKSFREVLGIFKRYIPPSQDAFTDCRIMYLSQSGEDYLVFKNEPNNRSLLHQLQQRGNNFSNCEINPVSLRGNPNALGLNLRNALGCVYGRST